MTKYETFLDRMRAEKPDRWPEPQEYAPFNQESITDDEACSAMALDDEHIMTLMGQCKGRTARMDMTKRALHVTARRSGGATTKAAIPLEKVTAGQMTANRYSHYLDSTFQIEGAELMDQPGTGTIRFDGPDDLSEALDFMGELASRTRAGTPRARTDRTGTAPGGPGPGQTEHGAAPRGRETQRKKQRRTGP